MGYREKITIVYRDGRVREFHDVFVKDTGRGIHIRGNNSNLDFFINHNRIDEMECRKRNTGGCFISTAVYQFDDFRGPKLSTLRQFRDETMLSQPLTKKMVLTYYDISPPIADFLTRKPKYCQFIKKSFVDPCVVLIEHYQSNRVNKKVSTRLFEYSIYAWYTIGLVASWILYKLSGEL